MSLYKKFKKAVESVVHRVHPATLDGSSVDLSQDFGCTETAGYKAVKAEVDGDTWNIHPFYWAHYLGATAHNETVFPAVETAESREEAQDWLDSHPMSKDKAILYKYSSHSAQTFDFNL